MTIKPSLLSVKSPVKLAGLFCILLFFSGCLTGKSPEEVTTLFWQALAQAQLENARKHVTEHSQHLVNLQDIEKHSTIQTGVAVIEDSDATVETTITRNKKLVTFNTVLLKEQDTWKVDYLQTQMNISMIPFGDVVKSLQNLGDTFAKQLEKQLPIIQKEMESLGNELKNQIDELGRSLEKPGNPNKSKAYPGTI
ncbi:hypothetical protein [Methyloglobulus sp.]|uniref:hypothetical protein n=1 Tax=Methyloglobulus sp. TaxID=2518622 RepID=UPI00398A33D7